MVQKILEYKFLADRFEPIAVRMPERAQLLSVQMHRGHITLWALVNADPQAPIRMRKLFWRMTFETWSVIQWNAVYVGTVQTDKGEAVHLFDHGEEY